MTISNKFSKQLRKNSTEPEKILWHYLRNRRFFGYKFRRQFTVGNYIVDFICLEKNLVIELDGREHLESDALEYDKKRTEFLNNRGLRVLRFYNTDIFNNIDSVLERIRELVVSPSSGFQPPSPLKGEGLKKNDSKQQLRNWAKEERSKLDMETLSKELVRKLKLTEEYKQAKHVMIFYPMKDEVNLLSLLEDTGKTFYLPKIEGDSLLCCKYDKDLPLCESCFHTKEPTNTNIYTPDLVIAPALAVDKKFYRLGYGKGFYDRFLRTNKVKTVVCVPKQLIVDTIFPEEFDIPADKVISV